MNGWHAKSTGQALRELGSDQRQGLSGEEALRRLERYGPNRLQEKRRKSLLVRLLSQLRDPMILVLLCAAGLSLWAGGGQDWLDAVIILVIVAVNAGLSISQEDSARRALEALRRMSAPEARVTRDGEERTVPAEELVPGDVIRLEAGDLVPADARILESVALSVDESALTGESVPVGKEACSPLEPDTPLADRKNMLLSATVVTGGRAAAVVTGTGMETEVGRIAGMMLETGELRTPLQKKMAELSGSLSFLCLCICLVLFGVGLLQGRRLLEMFLTAVSLAVAAIPEGLPAIVTIVLALGVQRMASRGAIVKKLPAVETLGCAGVICSDKTGTLTQNRMAVADVWTPRRGDRALALSVGTLCSNVVRRDGACLGDPTETAIVELAIREGLDPDRLAADWPRQAELPFSPQRKLMTTVHRRPEGGWRVCVKGAPDLLLRCCRAGSTARAAARNEGMADKALRVLGVAYKDLEFLPRALNSLTLEQDLTFVGLLGMADPPREDAREAVLRCRQAGIRPVMITGDHRLTAVAVARELGIFQPGDLAITGEDLDFLPQELLEQDVEKFSVYARVSPEHKLRIVRAWQARGKVTAMTGDGVNDAPALKAADIGCAMGLTGTDVAKSASDMILTDDRFATIVSAVEEGRGIYANIRKAIHYLLSSNIGEIFTVFAATLLGFDQPPLTPVQLLWLNLVTDSLPALALGVEPVEEGIMHRPPREASAGLFDRAFTLRLVWQGVMIGLLALTAYLLGLTADAHRAPGAANTMAFATLTLCQLFHALDARSERHSLLHIGLWTNRAMNRAFLAGTALQLAVLWVPALQRIFGTVPLLRGEWAAVLALAAAPVAICETGKALGRALRRRRRRAQSPSGRAA